MEWREKYSVGHSEMDDDHKQIFVMVDSFSAALLAGDGPDRLNTVFDELLNYMDVHFIHEVSHMKEIGYPNLFYHVTMHEKMVEKLRCLYDQHKLDDASSVVAEDMGEFLENWWYAHILTEDMSYKEFAESR
ncbi:MAG: hemerythrin family protein [Rhodospirillales bacterium]|jgi:hemerythrin-like metal-binding protein|nr:hemerythrin family protein [Rhodospirillales bacterium]